jgi:Na+/H+-translocating membrane pyrophosphatase
MRVFYATLIGLFVGGAISSVTEYYTGWNKPVMAIVQKSTGAGTNVIGLATGMISFSNCFIICSSHMVYLCWLVFLRSFSSISHDDSNGYAISN